MITVNHLSFTYSGTNRPAVDDISFSVSDGEIFGFLGPNGAGKSTTQNILIQLLKGYGGEVQLMGEDLSRVGKGIFERIGVCFELPNHYSRLTPLENLRFFARMYNSKTEDPLSLLDRVGLLDAKDVRVEGFSKGMKMRLNFARALLNQPDLLFLDEPTAGLDPVNARIIKNIILEKKRSGVTIFLTTHNMHDADELCDRVGFIVDGKIKRIGSPEELKVQHGEKTVRTKTTTGEEQEFPLEGLGHNEEFLTLIRQSPLETIHSRETTLEEIFIQITGRSLK